MLDDDSCGVVSQGDILRIFRKTSPNISKKLGWDDGLLK